MHVRVVGSPPPLKPVIEPSFTDVIVPEIPLICCEVVGVVVVVAVVVVVVAEVVIPGPVGTPAETRTPFTQPIFTWSPML